MSLRVRIRQLFTENKNRYGYRRIHTLLKCENTIVSEKTARRIMHEENLVVKVKTAKYNPYVGEITPSDPIEIERDFSVEKLNSKRLIDITECDIPTWKVYLSLIVDCFDGLLVSWKIGTFPDSTLVNTMLMMRLVNYPLVKSP